MVETQNPACRSTGWNCDHMPEFSNVPCTRTTGNGCAAVTRQLPTALGLAAAGLGAAAAGVDAPTIAKPSTPAPTAAILRQLSFIAALLGGGNGATKCAGSRPVAGIDKSADC